MTLDSSINQSYFYGADELYGWNASYYFTFFAEFQREWRDIVVIEVFFLLLLFIIAFAGNVTIILVIVKYKNMKSVTNYFLCNLAAASLLYTLGGPFIAVIRITQSWVLGEVMCHLLVYIEFVGGFVVIWTMTFISVDRFRRTVQYAKRRMAMGTCIAMIIILWILSAASFIPIAMYFVLVDFPFGDGNVTICTLIWPKHDHFRVSLVFVTPAAILGFVAPLCILVHNYFRTLRTFWISKRNLELHRQNQLKVEPEKKTSTSSASSVLVLMKSDKRAYKIVKALILIVVLFFVMWSPIFIIFAMVVLEANSGETTLRSSYFITTLTFTYMNAALNPILYCYFNDKLRKHFIDNWLTLFWCCRNCFCFKKQCYVMKKTSVGTQLEVFHEEASRDQVEDKPQRQKAVVVDAIEMSNFSNFDNTSYPSD